MRGLLAEARLLEKLDGKKKSFRDKYPPSNKWVSVKNLSKDPKTADELYDLIKTAYAKIGGHAKIHRNTLEEFSRNLSKLLQSDSA